MIVRFIILLFYYNVKRAKGEFDKIPNKKTKVKKIPSFSSNSIFQGKIFRHSLEFRFGLCYNEFNISQGAANAAKIAVAIKARTKFASLGAIFTRFSPSRSQQEIIPCTLSTKKQKDKELR